MSDTPHEGLTEQLAKLPCIPESGGPRVWGWGHDYASWDRSIHAHREYARVAGGILAPIIHGLEVERAAHLAKGSGAKFGLRVHPYKSREFWRREVDPPRADYLGSELVKEHERVYLNLMRAKSASIEVGVKVSRIEINIETWQRDSPRAVGPGFLPRVADRGLWNIAMYAKHIGIVEQCRAVFGPVPIGFYNLSPMWANTTLREPGPASCSLYRPTDMEKQEEFLQRTVAFQQARGISSVTAHVTVGAGWTDGHGSTWDRDFAYDPALANRLGAMLNRFDRRCVHDVIDKTAFYDLQDHVGPSQAWRDRIVPFFEGLLA